MKHFYLKITLLATLCLGGLILAKLPYIDHQKGTFDAVDSSSPNHLYSKTVHSVFAIYLESEIKNIDILGTGFLIEVENKPLIVTNEHVVPFKNQSYIAKTMNGDPIKVEVIYSNKEDDIAFLTLTRKTNIPPLKLATELSPSIIGKPVFTIGNPYDFLFSYSDGVISNINKNVSFKNGDFDELLIQTNINVNPGNSGGPLFNINGEVIGIISSMLDNSHGISFAIPSEVITEHLEQID